LLSISPLKKGILRVKIYTMNNIKNRNTKDYLWQLRTGGKYAFTLDDLVKNVPKPLKNIKKDIDRLREKGEAINIRRGFYTILPAEYHHMGVLPVEFYIDDLMTFLNKQYYVGLMSASMFHGAAHQQPQEFFVISEPPKLRNIAKDLIRINFSEKTNFPVYGVEDKKTETGYFKISGKELTFMDLVYFANNIGGFNRIITLLLELSEDMNLKKMQQVLKNRFPVAAIQRAGFLAEEVLGHEKLADVFANQLKHLNPNIVSLKTGVELSGKINEKWKIVVNTHIESDI